MSIVTTILAELPHPDISQPLARGVKYQHHFVVDLISDGKRLWHAASAEGQAIVAAIKREVSTEQDVAAAELAKAKAAELEKLQATPVRTVSPMDLDQLRKMAAELDAEIAMQTAAQAQPGSAPAPDVDPDGNPASNAAPADEVDASAKT